MHIASLTPIVREAAPAATYDACAKQKAAAKLARIPIKVEQAEVLKKPEWIRVKAGSPTTRFYEIKQILREHKLHTVCEEASCPNIGECFGKGIATFMIMGDKCTRRCPFCDVGHGHPDPLNATPPNLAKTIAAPNRVRPSHRQAFQVSTRQNDGYTTRSAPTLGANTARTKVRFIRFDLPRDQ